MIERIELFKNLNINPVPLDFTQSLTTTEWLLAIQKRLNMLIDEINKFDKKETERLNSLVTTLNLRIEELARKQNLEQIIENAQNIETINQTISNILQTINDLMQADDDLHNEIIDKYNYLVYMIEHMHIKIYSAIDGEYKTVQDAVNDIVDMFCKISSPTLSEFNSYMEQHNITLADIVDLDIHMFDLTFKGYNVVREFLGGVGNGDIMEDVTVEKYIKKPWDSNTLY